MQALENELRDRLVNGGFLKQPQVGVSVEQYRSQQIFVMGEVRQPGSLAFTGTMSIIEALARAGSTTERAGTEAVILRSVSGGKPPDAAAIAARTDIPTDPDVIRVNLQNLQGDALAERRAPGGGHHLRAARRIGLRVGPGPKRRVSMSSGRTMTVRQVLTLAGGVTERGSTRRIQIIRTVNGVDTTVPATLQDAVRPGDTIVVRESFF